MDNLGVAIYFSIALVLGVAIGMVIVGLALWFGSTDDDGSFNENEERWTEQDWLRPYLDRKKKK